MHIIVLCSGEGLSISETVSQTWKDERYCNASAKDSVTFRKDLQTAFGYNSHAIRNRRNPSFFATIAVSWTAKEFIQTGIGFIQQCDQVYFHSNVFIHRKSEL